MKIEKKYSKFAVTHTYDRMISAGVVLDANMLENFKSVLGIKAATKKYAEGQPLDSEDVEFLKSNIRVMIYDAIKRHDNDCLDYVKEDTSPHQYIMGAYYYLTALAMDALNCPELPNEMGKDLFPQATRRLIETKPPRKSAEQYFNKQRRKDFVDISGGIIALIEKIDAKKAEKKIDHKSIAELYGQYRALSERQARHTGIWRFFHGKENQYRNDLLELMRKSLKGYLPGGKIDLTKEPTEVYQDSLYSDYMKRINTLSKLTELKPEDAYGYGEYKHNYKPFPPDQEKESDSKKKDQEQKDKEQKDKENPVQENPVQENSDQEKKDQQDLFERLSGDLEEHTTERVSKIESSETQIRANSIN